MSKFNNMEDYKDDNQFINLIILLRNAFNVACVSVKERRNINIPLFGELLFERYQEVFEFLEKNNISSEKSIIGESIFAYFLSLSSKAEICMSNCLKDDSAISSQEFEINKNEYESLCNKLSDFSFEKNIADAVNIYIDSLVERGISQERLDLTIKFCNDELKELNVDIIIPKRRIGENTSNDKSKNLDALENYRKMLEEMCNGILEQKLQIERYEKNSVSINPINIYLHNKMGELYKFFEKKNFSFADSAIMDALSCYFILIVQDAKEELSCYWDINNSVVRAFLHELKNKRYGIEHIKKFNEICNKLYEFSIEKDCVGALNRVLDTYENLPGYNQHINNYIDRFNYELEKLGINQKIEERDQKIENAKKHVLKK